MIERTICLVCHGDLEGQTADYRLALHKASQRRNVTQQRITTETASWWNKFNILRQFGLLTFPVFSAGDCGFISLCFTLSLHCTQRNFKMANSALRLTCQRLPRLICFGGSTNGLIPSRSQEINVYLKRQLSSYLNSNSLVHSSRYRGVLSTTSSDLRKVIQGDITVRPTFSDKVLVCRPYSSFEHGCSQVWVLSIYWT